MSSETNIIRLSTETGSTYEIDDKERRIRRLGNSNQRLPTERTGEDLQWKSFCYLLVVGGTLLIDWEGSGQCTQTSRIVSDITDDDRIRLFSLGPITFVSCELESIKTKEIQK